MADTGEFCVARRGRNGGFFERGDHGLRAGDGHGRVFVAVKGPDGDAVHLASIFGRPDSTDGNSGCEAIGMIGDETPGANAAERLTSDVDARGVDMSFFYYGVEGLKQLGGHGAFLATATKACIDPVSRLGIAGRRHDNAAILLLNLGAGQNIGRRRVTARAVEAEYERQFFSGCRRRREKAIANDLIVTAAELARGKGSISAAGGTSILSNRNAWTQDQRSAKRS